MVHISNLSPWHRPPRPSLNRGMVQKAVRRAFAATGKAVLSTKELLPWAFARARGTEHNRRRAVRRVCERYCERVGRSTSVGRPISAATQQSGKSRGLSPVIRR
jgi:hypothetical protein